MPRPSRSPRPAAWPAVTAADDEYRHVSVTGRFLHDRETLVQAVTERGPGYWVLTPLQRGDGTHGPGQPRLRAVRAARRIDAPRRQSGRPGRDHRAAAHDRAEGRIPPGQRARSTTAGIRAMSPPSRRRAASHDVAPYFIDADAAITIRPAARSAA